jgi:hypothetical protein
LTWAGLVTDARVEQYLQALVARRILAAPDKSPSSRGVRDDCVARDPWRDRPGLDHGQQPAPVLKLIEPTADTILVGPITFRVSITGGRLRRWSSRWTAVEACRRDRSAL